MITREYISLHEKKQKSQVYQKHFLMIKWT